MKGPNSKDSKLTTEEKRLYYKTKQWKVLRKICYEMAGYCCQVCGRAAEKIGGDRQLHAHHTTYERHGEEDLEDLMCVCTICHEKLHGKKARLDEDGNEIE